MKNTAFAIIPRPAYASEPPERSPKYLALVRSQPCCVCGSWRGVESAHTGPHGIGQKASDYDAVPLCRKCHRTGPESLHKLGPLKFATAHGFDARKTISELNGLFGVKR